MANLQEEEVAVEEHQHLAAAEEAEGAEVA